MTQPPLADEGLAAARDLLGRGSVDHVQAKGVLTSPSDAEQKYRSGFIAVEFLVSLWRLLRTQALRACGAVQRLRGSLECEAERKTR
jgi:hypothetical protein